MELEGSLWAELCQRRILPQPQPHFQLVVSRRVLSSQSDRIMSGSARVVITPMSTRAVEQQHCLTIVAIAHRSTFLSYSKLY